ncbi:MAG: transmembrane anchor protein [Alphaproteobacteria bacterium]|nr:transmembrane anchor protein [Alphaproteobacteria bacterium]HAG46683.1 transmembrane anchor protein [Gammaproteobacteria bacterium]|tara:strand:- start:112 stop:729 length:618 start_codon:yes stop_codon:yes gene_type:complete
MFNAEKPNLEELPSSAQLIRSTVIAAIGAAVILIAVVLPAEYGIDPTGAGRVLGLTEMGEIKQELADEAEQDQMTHDEPEQSSSLLNEVFGLFVGTAHAQEAWTDTITFTLAPDAYTEIKLVMDEGAVAEYAWVAEGGRINFDLHAHGNGQSVDYDRGRGETSGEGSIDAPFAGEHGWFWRNRDSSAVTITLQLRGNYGDIVRSK